MPAVNTDNNNAEKIRIDKWLWAARFFKTRNLAIEAINGGKVHLNQQRTKPAKIVQIGDELRIRKGDMTFIIVVQALSNQRRSAPEAALLYNETPTSITEREQQKELHRQAAALRPRGLGRPTKRDRRLIHRFKEQEVE